MKVLFALLLALPAFGQFTPNYWKLNADGSISPKNGRSVANSGGLRNLNGPGIIAKCQGGIAAAAISWGTTSAPNSGNGATCESDGIQAYLRFTANLAQIGYDRFDLPSDWAGTLSVVLAAYSTSASAPTISMQLSCVSTGATASPVFGTAQTVSLTPGAASGRTAVTTTLITDAGHATKACAAGDTVFWKLSITANPAADLRVLAVRFVG